MPSYVSPYKGASGGLLPAGYADLLSKPGEYYNKAIASAGESIGSAIEKYTQNQQMYDYARGMGEARLSQLSNYMTDGQGGEDAAEQQLAAVIGDKNAKRIINNPDKLNTQDWLAISGSIDFYNENKNREMARQIQEETLRRYEQERVQDQLTNEATAAFLNEQVPDETAQQTIGQPFTMRRPNEQEAIDIAQQYAATIAGAGGDPGAFLKNISPYLPSSGYTPKVHDIEGQKFVETPDNKLMQVGGEQLSPTEQAARDSRVIPPATGYKGMAPSAQEAKEFREFATTVKDVEAGVNELIDIANMRGENIDLGVRARAKTIAQMMIGALRLPIVGPGAVSEKELQLLQSIVANPTELTRLDITAKESLSTLNRVFTAKLKQRAEILGLESAPQDGWTTSATTGRRVRVTQ